MEPGESLPVDRKPRSEKRRRARQIKVRVSAEEQELIDANARASGLGVPEFLRCLGKGHAPRSMLDQILIRDLCIAAGDVGRLGGLIKAWMVEKRSGALPAGGPGLSELDSIYRDLREACALLKKRASEL